MKEKAKRNDELRARIPSIHPPDRLLLTRGIASLPEEEVIQILRKVKEFDDFTEENDPWGEHDFGSFTQNGQKIFWKIDDYGGQQGWRLVLTIMFASEY